MQIQRHTFVGRMSAVSYMKYSEINELYLCEISFMPRLLYHGHSVLQQQRVFSACVNNIYLMKNTLIVETPQ